MDAFFEEIFTYLIGHYALYLVVVMSILMMLILVVLNLIKKPIKKLTSKIKSERVRKLANKSIIVLSFGIAIGVWFALNAIAPNYFKINWLEILFTGALPVVGYAVGEGLISVSTAKNLVNSIKDAADDGVIADEEAKDIAKKLATAVDGEAEEAESPSENSDTDTADTAEDTLKKLLDG